MFTRDGGVHSIEHHFKKWDDKICKGNILIKREEIENGTNYATSQKVQDSYTVFNHTAMIIIFL